MTGFELSDPQPRRPRRPRRLHRPRPTSGRRGAALAAALLLSALPVLAAAPEQPGDEREVRKERVVLLANEGAGEGGLLRGVHLLGGGYLGVELMPLTRELRAHFGVPEDRGVMVARVAEDSPAEKAGLQVGDIVTAAEGEAVEGPWGLSVAVRGKAAGEELALEVWRDGRPLDFAVSVEERDRERVDLAPLLWRRSGDGPQVFGFRERGDGEGPTLYFEPEVVERLGESIDKIDWPRLNQRLGERNRELERRLGELEKRLQELEKALRE